MLDNKLYFNDTTFEIFGEICYNIIYFDASTFEHWLLCCK